MLLFFVDNYSAKPFHRRENSAPRPDHDSRLSVFDTEKLIAPLADACAPVITTAISLMLYAHVPGIAQILGIVSAITCVLIFSRE